MERLHFQILINAPKEIVWDTMLNEKTYRQWTSVFNPISYYKGSWTKGSKISFIGPDPDGKIQGMYSEIAENRKYDFISIKHLGMIKNGQIDLTSEKAKEWASAFENYSFRIINNQTELSIDVDTINEFSDQFNELWPKALHILKTLAEQSVQ